MFEYKTIQQYHHALKQEETSCADVTRYFLNQIEKKRHLNAFVHIFGEEALQQARRLDENRKAGKTQGKLHGVVIAIKDVICYKDHPVSASSAIMKNFQ